MLKRIKNFDIYGTLFNLTIYQHSKYKSILGGFVSMITIAWLVLIIYYFGLDFYTRDNPRILSQEKFPEERTIYDTINETTFPVMFEFFLADGTPFNISNIFYPTLSYTNATRLDSYNFEFIQGIPIEITKCLDNPKYIIKNGIDMTNKYCAKYLENMHFMADDNMIYDALTLEFRVCDPKNITRCTDYNILNKVLSMQPVVNILFPSIKFYPWNANQPLINTYISKYFYVNKNLLRSDYFYLKKVKFYDDSGWLIKSEQEKDGYDIAETEFFYDIVLENQIIQKNIIYSVHFSMTYSYNYKSRSYMKLQELIANVGGVLNLFMYLCRIVIGRITPNLMNQRIFNEFFDINE